MRRGPIGVTISLLLSVILALPPLAFSAGGGRGGGGGAMAGLPARVVSGVTAEVMGAFAGARGGFHRGQGGFNHSSFHHGRGFFNHRFGRFSPFGAFISPVAYWGWPGGYGWPGYGWPYYYGSALYDNQSAYYGGGYGAPSGYASAPASSAPVVYSVNLYNPPPAAAAVQPVYQPAPVQPVIYEPPASPGTYSAPSPQGVVEYEGGRYELRGDGMTIAYKWVWIPNPPSGPPGTAAARAPLADDLAPAGEARSTGGSTIRACST